MSPVLHKTRYASPVGSAERRAFRFAFTMSRIRLYTCRAAALRRRFRQKGEGCRAVQTSRCPAKIRYDDAN